MERRRLGSGGLEVSAIGFGCMGLNSAYGTSLSQAEADRLLARAVDLGVTFFDTAEVYGPYTNEEMVGRALKPFRHKVQIATKFGFDIPAGQGVWLGGGMNSKPANIRRVTEESLKRLGVEAIDLMYQHRVDPETPMEDVAGAVGELVKEGKIKYFGMSEAGPTNIRRAHAVHPVACLQSEYSLWTRDPEDAVLPVLRELGIGFVPFSPLGRGFLTGAVTDPGALGEGDLRRTMPRFQGEAFGRNLSLVETLKALAARKGYSAGQLALAWLLHQGPDIVPIPGTTKLHRLEENAGAADVRLTPEDLAEIAAAIPESEVAGDRYNARVMASVDRA
jgi:aryl-alcohol dehydrogenase-like predicted oxidoreductase